MNDLKSKNQMISDILTHYEAEKFIETLVIYPVNEYGSSKWFKQHELLTKLNQQAHINAMLRSDEFVMESLATFDKIRVLIYDLLVSEAWKANVLPLMKDYLANLRSYRPYLSIYHEAEVLNILEVSLYHRTAVEAAENFLIELIDYCYRKLTTLLSKGKSKEKEPKTVQDFEKRTKLEEFQEQMDELEFSISMMCISIMRFITDHVKHLPLNIVHHLLVETDMLSLLVPLIEERPWLRTTKKKEREIFEGQKWVFVPKEEYARLPKLEAQVWIAIYNIFMDKECKNKYELNEYRKSNLLRLKKYINEVLVDQIPNLSYLQRALEELSLTQVGPNLSMSNMIISQLPEVRTEILKDKNWKEIAEFQKKNYFIVDEKTLQEDIQRISSLYDYNILEGLVEGFKCAQCGKEASKRCSKCKTEYYCSRECQVSNWPEHKPTCTMRTTELDKKKEAKPEISEVKTQTTEKKQVLISEVKPKVEETSQKNEETTKASSNHLDELD